MPNQQLTLFDDIRQMWAQNVWPQKWTGEEINGDVPIDAKWLSDSGRIITQSLLVP